MAKRSAKAEVNTFVKGLITEASPLNFPADACTEIENFELNRDGTLDRRLGLDFEDDFQYRGISIADIDPNILYGNTFKWEQVSGDGGTTWLVIQYGRQLHFLDMTAESLSGEGFIGFIQLTEFPTTTQYSFASVDGKLVVAGGDDTIAVVTANLDTLNIGFEYQRLLTRDLWGVQESPDTENDKAFRPFGLTFEHQYNLRNQSWGITRKDHLGNYDDPLDTYISTVGDSRYPSNSEVVWTGLQFQPVSGSASPFERIFGNLYKEALGADVLAAKGYFIIDVLRRGQSRAEQVFINLTKFPELSPSIGAFPSDLSVNGASCIASFAGRVFYAGFEGQVLGGDRRSPNLSDMIFFSQTIKNSQDFVKCYQEGDPTSRENNDIVDTDGGFIKISGVDKIIHMINLSTSLIVFAGNGVWSITGGSDFGFSATNFKVDKISNFGAVNRQSIVEDGSRCFYWGNDGIYVIGKDQFGAFGVQNITETTIQKFYQEIPYNAKLNSKGAYDSISKKVRWLYKENPAFNNSEDTFELILDLVLNAYSVNRLVLPDNNSAVIGIFQTLPFSNQSFDDIVFVGSDVVLAGTETVVVGDSIRVSGSLSIKYLFAKKQGPVSSFTFAFYRNQDFLDFFSYNNVGVDAEAFLLTGDVTAGDSALAKQIPYLTMHLRRTENGVDENLVPTNQSSCLIQTQWDWANSVNSNKFGREFQAYRYRRAYLATDPGDPFDTGFELVTTRNKIRGRGRAFSLSMRTEPQKDCRIVGWNLAVNGNEIT